MADAAFPPGRVVLLSTTQTGGPSLCEPHDAAVCTMFIVHIPLLDIPLCK